MKQRFKPATKTASESDNEKPPIKPPSPFGDSLPRRHDLSNELAWADKKPRRAGPFCYSSQLGSDEIRLVILYPGDSSEDIALSTEVLMTDHVEDDYAALSYVWGSPGDTRPIYVDGHEFPATKNLVSALRQIRGLLEPDQTLPLWIDAISINQKDTVERNAQVAAMRRIYEEAALFITWLGVDYSSGLDYLKELGEWAFARDEHPASVKPKRDRIEGPQHVKGRLGEIKAAMGIVLNEYWGRVWTVQEYSSPALGILVCGDSWMDRSLLSPALRLYIHSLALQGTVLEKQGMKVGFIESSITSVENLLQKQKPSYARAARQMPNSQVADEGRIDRFPFLGMLLKFRDHKSTDPRDKVYAPLMLSSASRKLSNVIPVDYSLSTRDLFIRVALHCLHDSGWPLSILELCRLGASKDLPSWVPDWRTLPRRVLTRDTSTGEQVLDAGKGVFAPSSEPRFQLLAGDLLQLEGIRLDVLTQVWPSYFAEEMREKSELSITVNDADSAYIVTGEKMLDVYRNCVNPYESNDESPEAPDGTVVLAKHEQWRRNRKIVSRINRRRLGRTSNGFIGLVPAESEIGDEVWLLRGGNVFHILRRTTDDQEKRVLVGEALVHGLLHGGLESLTGPFPRGLPGPQQITLE